MPTVQSERMLDVLKRAAAVLRDENIPFALGGGLALWSYGGSATDHDIDLLLRDRESAEAAVAALEARGLRREDPPEEWLLKVWDGDVLIDLVFAPTGVDSRDALERAEEQSVHAMVMPVLRPEDVFVSKLEAMTDHYMRFEPLLEHARSLREQVDWVQVARRTADSPFARAFLVLLEGLGVLPADGVSGRATEPALEYAAAHAEEALAEDGRVAEQGLHVGVEDGHLVVSGVVSDEDRKASIVEVVKPFAGDETVVDLTSVVAEGPPTVEVVEEVERS